MSQYYKLVGFHIWISLEKTLWELELKEGSKQTQFINFSRTVYREEEFKGPLFHITFFYLLIVVTHNQLIRGTPPTNLKDL